MNEFICHEEIKDGSTFLLDDTTKEAIKDNPNQIEGKIVTLVDNSTVGYGSTGATPLGFVSKVEYLNVINSEPWVVSVLFNECHECIPCAGTETAGKFAACDGKGGIKESTTYTGAKIYSVDTENKTCTVYIGG